MLAAELSATTRYCDEVIQIATGARETLLLDLLDCPRRSQLAASAQLEQPGPAEARQAVLLYGALNDSLDIETELADLHNRLPRGARLLIVLFNPFLAFFYRWAGVWGLPQGPVPTTFVTQADLDNLCRLAGFDIVRQRRVGYCPWRLWGLGDVINSWLPLMPGLRHFALTTVVALRPVRAEPAERRPSLSIIVPARNERGNIAAAIARLPHLACPLEVIFVEGHSTDGTWEEIERALASYHGPATLLALRQTGVGKADAVRLGCAHATGELLTILDADLTMPPELLGRFYDAWRAGHADFINGSRLVYPMEGEAMRFLNRLGNVFFAKALSFVLGVRLGDVLCGTKLFARADYLRFVAWRGHFGDFDPFGDFELLFPAAELGLGIVDVPIRYRARTYGTTNIQRFWHGAQLLLMTWHGLCRVARGRTP